MDTEQLVHTCPKCGTLIDISEVDPFSEIQCPSCGESMRVRDRFDHYQITAFIASGGMGSVYKATDLNLGRVVALKLLRKDYNENAEYIQKLETEAKITASVMHPYVVKVYSFGCDHGVYYIAMELVDKGSLDDLMTLQGRVAEAQVLEIGIQVAQGLRAAYRAGLIHRDVKPGNILFADAHTAKIVDFGLAMPLEQAAEGEEEIWGTPYYVAPEKLNHEPEDFRSDIYSLGGTLFHAIAGRPPFEAENASFVALKHLKSQVVSLQAFAPDVSSPTAYVINRMQAKNPAERYASYDELIEHLEYARNELLTTAGQARQPKNRVVVEDEKQNTLFGIIMFAAIAVLLMVGGVLYIYRDSIVSRHSGGDELARQQMVRSVDSVANFLARARGQMAAGKTQASLTTLATLGPAESLPEATQLPAALHLCAARLQAGQFAAAREGISGALNNATFGSRDRDEGERSRKFLNTLAGVLWSRGKTLDPALNRWNTGDYEPFGLFLCGLKEWDAARFEAADGFFQKFIATAASPLPWVEAFKPLAQKYRDDFAELRPVLDLIKAAKTPEQTKLALKAAEKLRSKAKTQGRLSVELGCYIASLHNPPLPSKATTLKELKTLVDRRLGAMQPGEALAAIDAAALAPSDATEKEALKKKTAIIADLKKRMIDELNGMPQNRWISRRDGTSLTGRIAQVNDQGFRLASSAGVVPWSDVMPSSILVWADSLLGDAAERQWLAGAYAAVAGYPDAKDRLRTVDPKAGYAASLPLFEK
jgi:eukaryotic-like serine/threonine-protein kinase